MWPSIHQLESMRNIFAGTIAAPLASHAGRSIKTSARGMGAKVLTEVIHGKRTRARHQSGPFRVGRSRTGLGLFATEPIRKGKFIIEYWGKRIRWKDVEDEDQNRYYFDLNTRWAIDGLPRR